MTDQTELFPVSDADLSRLRDRLAAAADRRGLLDIAYRVVDSPIGPLLLAATDRGLVRVAFESEGFDAVLDTLATKVSPSILSAPARLDPIAVQLDDYFAHRRQRFDVPFLQLSAFFLKAVLAAIPALLLLGVLLFFAGKGLQAYFPELVHTKILISFPNG